MSPFLVLLIVLPITLADYECICNYDVEASVYAQASTSQAPIGYLYEFDCKPVDHSHSAPNADFLALQFEKKTGYVAAGSTISKETCPGTPPLGDLVPVTIKPQTSTIRSTTMTPTTTGSTSTRRTTITAPTPTNVPQGNITKCPDHVIKDTSRQHGMLGQYGNFCYELVPRKSYWPSAEFHCHFFLRGHLLHVVNAGEQNFINDFLRNHSISDNVWMGLTDKDHEANYTWSSGVPVTYTNFADDFNVQNHALYDCFVMQQGGNWTDKECDAGLGFVSHPDKYASICQYSINSTLGSIGDVLHNIVG